jgi:hypothetical protein
MPLNGHDSACPPAAAAVPSQLVGRPARTRDCAGTGCASAVWWLAGWLAGSLAGVLISEAAPSAAAPANKRRSQGRQCIIPGQEAFGRCL